MVFRIDYIYLNPNILRNITSNDKVIFHMTICNHYTYFRYIDYKFILWTKSMYFDDNIYR